VSHVPHATSKRLRHILLGAACLAAVSLFGTSGPARAQDLPEGTLLEDTEIGMTLNAFEKPLAMAGNLNPDTIHLHIMVDDEINAFATQGNNMVIFTGLLFNSKNSGEVIGVMAHETGHIHGGHFIVTSQEMAGPNTISLLGTLLGLAAGALSGRPDLGMAVMMGGQRAAIGQYLTFSRGIEAQADEYAMFALNATHQSPKWLYDFFGRLKEEEQMYAQHIDPYLTNHPLTSERMDRVKAAMDTSPYANAPLDPEMERLYKRMIAKLYAFLKPQYATLQKYPETDKSVEARYARTIAYYRKSQFDKAMPLVDSLLTDNPKDPFFWQIKGDMLLSRSKLDQAIDAYRQALKTLPNAPEILISMAHAMVESHVAAYSADCQAALKHALDIDPENPDAWDLLATSYADSNNAGMSAYAAAERAMLTGQFGDVARYSNQAEKLLEKGTPTWYRLQDIKVSAQNALEDMKKKRR
jgi:predicted Zn-dependent protease